MVNGRLATVSDEVIVKICLQNKERKITIYYRVLSCIIGIDFMN